MTSPVNPAIAEVADTLRTLADDPTAIVPVDLLRRAAALLTDLTALTSETVTDFGVRWDATGRHPETVATYASLDAAQEAIRTQQLHFQETGTVVTRQRASAVSTPWVEYDTPPPPPPPPPAPTLWGNLVERAPELDDPAKGEAWRILAPCDNTCHHPVHAFGTPRGCQHLEWLTPSAGVVIYP